MSEPRTEAGRALLARMHPDGRAEADGGKIMALIGLAYDANLEAILAIENEASAVELTGDGSGIALPDAPRETGGET